MSDRFNRTFSSTLHFDRVERQMFALRSKARGVYLRHNSFVIRSTPLKGILHFLRIERKSHRELPTFSLINDCIIAM